MPASTTPWSRLSDRNILESFRAKHGDKPVALLERKHVERILAEKTDKPAAQRNLLRVLRTLLGFCVEEGWRKDNPTASIKVRYKGGGFHSWTESEIAQFEARHPIGSKARLALALLLWTASRRSDVVRLGPPNIVTAKGEQRLQLTQSKTGAVVDMPLVTPLAQIIAATPMVGVKTFLVTDYGKPFTAAGFGGWFRDRCDEADLPNWGGARIISPA